MQFPHSQRLCNRLAGAITVVTLALSGCGGGIFIDVGDRLDDPPSVSLAAPASAAAGSTIRLTAAAADDIGVQQVTFFRVDGNNEVQLGTDSRSPYEIDAQIPPSATGAVQFFARAIDFDGNEAQSDDITVNVVP